MSENTGAPGKQTSGPGSEPDRRELLKTALRAVEEMRARLESVEREASEPIAIIGLGCRMPGNVETPDAFWELLSRGVDAISEVPEHRWNAARYAALGAEFARATPRPRAGFLAHIDAFDAHFFGIAPREAVTMDPQHRMALEAAWEALEDAGLAPDSLKGSQTGVFLGITAIDYAVHMRVSDLKQLDVYSATGSAANAAAGRVSYVLGLHGPSMAVDTACSSSLTAIHLACQSLRLRESNLALAGGVNTLIIPDWFVSMERWGMLAPDSRCKAFDAGADGMVRAEGCGILVLKRLSDAVAAGDRVLALIRGSAVNQDGPSSGLTVPNGPAQEAVMRQALRAARLKPSDVSYVEAHGTGTTLGDPIELEAIDAVMGEGRPQGSSLVVGSVKTNVGHLEAASGVAGLIKVVLSMQHGEIPRNLNFTTLNPAITLRNLQVQVPTTTIPWPAVERTRVAGVSSFGLSGTNAHVVLEEAPRPAPRTVDRPHHVLTISARSASALRRQAERWQQALRSHPEWHPGDVAHTANTGRAALPHRAALVGSSLSQFDEQLGALATERTAPGMFVAHVRPKDRQRVAFLFTGQGSQYAGMARELYRTQPVFRASVDRSAQLLQSDLDRPLLSVIYPERADDGGLINQTGFTQPALFAVEYALFELWASWGIAPAAVMGHSVGEYVAACVAGVFSLEDGLKLIAARGRLMQALPAGGKMAAVAATENQLRSVLGARWEGLSVAAVNAPASVVISGASALIHDAVAMLKSEGVAARPLTVSHAFHSALMDPILAAFLAEARKVSFKAPRLTLVSNLTGLVFEDGEIPGPEYWARHLREAVRFAEGVKTLDARGFKTFLELGPAPTLSGLGRNCLPDRDAVFLPSLRKERSDWQEILSSAGQLFARGAPIDWRECDRGFDWTTVSLPTYPFERERYWVESADAAALVASKPASGQPGRLAQDGELHPLLGRRLQSALREVQFEQLLAPQAPAFLADHVIHGRVVVPATAFVEMLLAAADVLWTPGAHQLGDLVITEPLHLDDLQPVLVQTIVTRGADGHASAQVLSRNPAGGDADAWTVHVSANLIRSGAGAALDAAEPIDRAQARCTEPSSRDDLYAWFSARGITYGERFSCLEQLWRGDREAIGRVRWPELLTAETGTYRLHPAIMDSCLQAVVAALPADAPDRTYVPVNIAQVITHDGGAIRWAHARLHPIDAASGELIADVSVFDGDGRLVADIRDLRARAASANWGISKSKANDWLYDVRWVPEDGDAAGIAPASLSGTWVVLGSPRGFGAVLTQRIDATGGKALLVLAPNESAEGLKPWRRVDPGQQADIVSLCEAAGAEPGIAGYVHLWGMANAEHSLDRDVSQTAGDVRRGVRALLHLTQALVAMNCSTQLVVATRLAQAAASGDGVDAAQAASWGLARTIRVEHPELHCRCVDLDTAADASDADALCRAIAGAHSSAPSAAESEVAVRLGRQYFPRLVPSELRTRLNAHEDAPDDVRVLDVQNRGVLDSINITIERRRAPGPGEVEIKVAAAALNFRDVLNALGMYPGDAGRLGSECAGTVVGVGPGVEQLRVGDEVVGMPASAFRTYVTSPTDCLVRKPVALTMAEAATVPIAFLTAEYGLTTLARMKRGDRVLIHAATGGVGLAAVQLALRAGAEIFATAGSDEKRAYLKKLGVTHIFSSRTLSFADEIMAATGGRGVDIVLNSLTGEFITESVRVLARDGRFVEIGKAGIWTAEQMAAARPDVAYFPLYLGDVAPATTLPMLSRLLEDIAAGQLRPLPQKTFGLDAGVEAFRYMAQARHIGKVVLDCTNAEPSIRADATYIVTGGFGALGAAVAGSLAVLGAGHLVLVGRTGTADDAAAALVTALESLGTHVTAVAADVADSAAVAALFDSLAAGPPVRGIVHAAGIVDDGLLMQQSWEQFEKVLAPKVMGAWNLHELSSRCPLDFFVLFSSSASLLPTAGQGSYAAANAFLDGLAAARRAADQTAVSVNWGPWADAGMGARVSTRDRERWQRQGIGSIAVDQGTGLLARILAGAPPQVCVLPVDWRAFAASYPADARPAIITGLSDSPRHQPAAAASAAVSLPELLRQLPASERRQEVYRHVSDVVRRVFGVDPSFAIDPQQGLRDLGLDSLMAVELRNDLQRSAGQSLPATLAFDYPSLESLAHYLTTLLSADLSGPDVTTGASQGEVARADAAGEIRDLSDAEAEALLAEELSK